MADAEKESRAVDDGSVARSPSGQLRWISWLGAAVLAFLALHSLSYGSFFVADPSEGAREFGGKSPSCEAAENLVGLVGVILLLLAVTALTAAILLLRRRPGGAWLTLGLGIVTSSIGAYWAALGSTWDVGIYGSFGLLLTGTGALSMRYMRRAIRV